MCIDYQFDIEACIKKFVDWISFRVCLQGIIWIHLIVGLCLGYRWQPLTGYKEESSHVLDSPLCFLTMNLMWPIPSDLCHWYFPHHNGLYLLNQNRLLFFFFFFKVAFIGTVYHSNSKSIKNTLVEEKGVFQFIPVWWPQISGQRETTILTPICTSRDSDGSQMSSLLLQQWAGGGLSFTILLWQGTSLSKKKPASLNMMPTSENCKPGPHVYN